MQTQLERRNRRMETLSADWRGDDDDDGDIDDDKPHNMWECLTQNIEMRKKWVGHLVVYALGRCLMHTKL